MYPCIFLLYLMIIKRFGNELNLSFQKKSTLRRNIIIIEDNIVYADKMEVAEKLNNFFVEAVDYLEFSLFCENDIRKYS